MLVLSRKQQQEIVIGDNVKITVLKVKGNTVRLGIEAPREVKVVRGELPRETEQPEMANVTVVFNDPVDRPKNARGAEPGVLKFESPDDEQPSSISFRQITPESLKHNRLKEIVKDISESK